jgi:succinate-semialdehyde dehydrogenase/glutarate-semialdehyde dehydrogenase
MSWWIFIEELELHMQELKVRGPMDEETDIGPLARMEFVDSLKKALSSCNKIN